MSLRRQFVLVFVSLTLILTAILGWLGWRVSRSALEERLDETLRQVVETSAAAALPGDVIGRLRLGMEGNENAWTPYFLRLRELASFGEEALLFGRDNALLISSEYREGADSLKIGTPLVWLPEQAAAVEAAWRDTYAATPFFRDTQGRLVKYGFGRTKANTIEGEHTDVMLGVRVNGDEYFAPLTRFGRTVLVVSLVALLVGIIVAGFLSTGVARPIERLSRAALRIQRGRMDEEVVVERGVELGRLSRAMERMRKGVLERDEQLRLMLAQVAHEIRNPLGGLELFASALVDADDDAERTRLLGRVSSEVQALDRIIADFLTFARPPQPRSEFTDLRDPIRAAAELAEVELENEGGRLMTEFSPEPLWAQADPDQVKRVVLNLLRNAGQAGDEVRLTAGWRNGEVEVVVTDNGPGIPEDLRDRVFDPFVTDKEQGAGLGLAIVKKLMDANRGRVELFSGEEEKPGVGAEFRLYFMGSDDLRVSDEA